MPAIRHLVFFRLKHAAGSPAERAFLAAAQALEALPGVEKFELLHQVGRKNAFTLGLAMEFADADAYARYNAHPEHVRFVQERWLPEVAEFLEIDTTPYGTGR